MTVKYDDKCVDGIFSLLKKFILTKMEIRFSKFKMRSYYLIYIHIYLHEYVFILQSMKDLSSNWRSLFVFQRLYECWIYFAGISSKWVTTQ